MARLYSAEERRAHLAQYERDYRDAMGAAYGDLPIPRLHATVDDALARAESAEFAAQAQHDAYESEREEFKARALKAEAEVARVTKDRDAVAKRAAREAIRMLERDRPASDALICDARDEVVARAVAAATKGV